MGNPKRHNPLASFEKATPPELPLRFDPAGLCPSTTSQTAPMALPSGLSGPYGNFGSTFPQAIGNFQQPRSTSTMLPSPALSDVLGEVIDELPAIVPSVGEAVTYVGASFGSSALISSGIALASPEAIVISTGIAVIYKLGPVAFAPIPTAH